MRVAISRRRSTLRESSRLVTLAQAMSSTRPTAHSKSRSAWRVVPSSSATRGRTAARNGSFAFGLNSLVIAAIVVSSTARACSTDTAGRRRATATIQYNPRFSSAFGPTACSTGAQSWASSG